MGIVSSLVKAVRIAATCSAFVIVGDSVWGLEGMRCETHLLLVSADLVWGARGFLGPAPMWVSACVSLGLFGHGRGLIVCVAPVGGVKR